MRGNEELPKLLDVRDAAGAVVTGLTITDFTVLAYGRGYGASIFTTYTHSTDLQAIGGGLYDLAFLLPPSAGFWHYRILPTNPAYRIITPNEWSGEVEVNDLDSLYGSVVRPVATISQSAQLGMPLPMELVAYRYRTMEIPVVDQAGDDYDLLATDFPSATLRISIRSKDRTTTKWDAGPTGVISVGAGTAAQFAISTTGNILAIAFPEDSGFFAALTAAVAAGKDTVDDLYVEVTGDKLSVAARTQPVIRSSNLRLTREEVGT